MDGWVFFAFLIIGAFIFSFAGVIFLLVKMKRQEEGIKEIKRELEKLKSGSLINDQRDSPLKEGAPVQAEYFETVPPPAQTEVKAQTTFKEEAPSLSIPPYYNTVPPAKTAVQKTMVPARQILFFKAIVSFMKSGNLWAAGGVVLLIAGFGTLIAFLGSRGFFTVEMGIAAAIFAGLTMVILGWVFRKRHGVYFVILQGGGIGIVYLAVFAAYKLTPHLNLPLALILMSLLVPPALIMALFQKMQGLALLGFLGGFAAPILLSGGDGNHLFLFSYYLVLCAGVFSIGFFIAWRELEILAFISAFGISIFWTLTEYKPEFLFSSEPFFIVYFIIFTVMGLRGVKKGKNLQYRDIILILGTPAAAAALQWKIFSYIAHGYAFVAIAFSAFYLFMAVLIAKKWRVNLRAYAEGYLALGVLLANIIIPLELSPGIGGAAWAVEGAVLFFLGLRASPGKWFGDIRITGAGILIHLASAAALLRNTYIIYGAEPSPWRSPVFSGSLIIALSAFFIAALPQILGKKTLSPKRSDIFSQCAAIWGFIWWFGGWYYELLRVFNEPSGSFLILASASALLSWLAMSLFSFKFLMPGMLPAPVTAAIMILKIFWKNMDDQFSYSLRFFFNWNFLESSRYLPWLVFFLSHILMIFFVKLKVPAKLGKIRGNEPVWWRELRISIIALTALAVFSAQGRYFTIKFDLSESWTSLSGLLPFFMALLIFPFCFKKQKTGKLLSFLPVTLSLILVIWFIIAFFDPGNPSPLPLYIPVINPLDLLEALCIASILFWQVYKRKYHSEGEQILPGNRLLIQADIMVFFWVVSILARSVYHYAGVSWRRVAGSDIFQLCLFIFWALYGILHIITGHRLKKRAPWIAGALLVTVDIIKLILLDLREFGAIPRILSFFAAGLMLLFIGWAAPLPPHKEPEK